MRALLAWLNKKFPEQLVITKLDYDQLRQEVAQYNIVAQQVQELYKMLQKVEKDLTTLSRAQGFGSATGKGFGSLER